MKDGNKISREFDKFIPGSMNLEFKQKGEINLVNLFLADIFFYSRSLPMVWSDSLNSSRRKKEATTNQVCFIFSLQPLSAFKHILILMFIWYLNEQVMFI